MKYKGITIHKHKSCNTWYTRYRNVYGKQVYLSARTQIECYNKLKLSLKQKFKEELTFSKNEKIITFVEWYNIWLKTYKPNISDATKSDYKQSLSRLTNLQNKELKNITGIDIIQELNRIEKKRAKQKTYEFLIMLFDKALKTETINKNPMLSIDRPDYKRVNGLPFSVEDEKKFIEICNNKKLDMFLVGLYQGLRKGEFLAITKKDIDFENKTLNINKSLLANGTFGKTKNNSDRLQPIFDNTYNILIKYKNSNGRIFLNDYNQTEKIFNKIRDENLSCKKYSIKTLRYTFITKCGEIGIPEHIIQKWVGHRNGSQITKQVYTKVREHAEQENIKIINKLNSNSTQTKNS